MQVEKKTKEYDFRAQLGRAVTHRVLCARFEWYASPPAADPELRKLLGTDQFLSERIFQKLEETFIFGDLRHRNNYGFDHALIYVFDGRDGSSKFHANLWKPSMGRDLMPLEYFDANDANPYLPYVMDALLMQDAAVKVSTVVERAFAKVRRAKAARLPDGVQPMGHKVLLRDTLMRLRHTDPLICFASSNRANQPHMNRGCKVEHLGIYDRKPTWNL